MTESSQRDLAVYPPGKADRDRWIVGQRGARVPVRPDHPHAFLREYEPGESGVILETWTIFLTNRECPWRCVMCDLWKTTLLEKVPNGSIPAQIDYALRDLELGSRPSVASGPKQLKLYNGGSFFDPAAIPREDYDAAAMRAATFERVIVECHPAFVGNRCLTFQSALQRAAQKVGQDSSPALEVAMGLETADRAVLERLNKGMTLELFQRSAAFLRAHGMALRVFVLVQPPFAKPEAALSLAEQSIDFAFDAGASAVSLIPTRGGNGAMETLAAAGMFSPPRLSTLEAAQTLGIARQRGRVFADLWDLEKFLDCPKCFQSRLERLDQMNRTQRVAPPVTCTSCGAGLTERSCTQNSPR